MRGMDEPSCRTKAHRVSHALSLRRATVQDADLLLRWRNDPRTRGASHNTAEVDAEAHRSWLTRVLEDANRRLFVAQEKGHPVGAIRADYLDGACELSWTVAPDARGRGVGKSMVALLAHRISEPIRAEVRVGNGASIRIAESAGMTCVGESGQVLHFERGALE